LSTKYKKYFRIYENIFRQHQNKKLSNFLKHMNVQLFGLIFIFKLDYIEVVKLLVGEYKANINHQDKVMQSAYHDSKHHIICFAYIFILRMDIHLPM
jgi:hypothetical protein